MRVAQMTNIVTRLVVSGICVLNISFLPAGG